jgi:hypothetical protein
MNCFDEREQIVGQYVTGICPGLSPCALLFGRTAGKILKISVNIGGDAAEIPKGDVSVYTLEAARFERVILVVERTLLENARTNVPK